MRGNNLGAVACMHGTRCVFLHLLCLDGDGGSVHPSVSGAPRVGHCVSDLWIPSNSLYTMHRSLLCLGSLEWIQSCTLYVCACVCLCVWCLPVRALRACACGHTPGELSVLGGSGDSLEPRLLWAPLSLHYVDAHTPPQVQSISSFQQQDQLCRRNQLPPPLFHPRAPAVPTC